MLNDNRCSKILWQVWRNYRSWLFQTNGKTHQLDLFYTLKIKMLIKAIGQEILKKYTIEKKNIKQQERTLQHRIWDRTIKLYTKDFYLPN
jgi:hypothetical protein